MKKLLLLICALLGLGASGAWADTMVTLVDGTSTLPLDKYGQINNTSSPNTFTTNTASGFAGLVLSAPTISQSSTWWSQGCIALKPAIKGTEATVSLSVPSGYIITGLSLCVRGMNSTDKYSVTVNGETKTIDGSNDYTFTPSGLSTSTFNFTINQTGGTSLNWLAIKSLSVTIAPHEDSFDVTYNLYYNSEKITATTRKHLDGDTPAIPGSLDNGLCTYTYDVATITAGSTTEVKVTASSPIKFSTDFANATWYYIYARSSTQLYYSSSKAVVQSTNEAANGEKWAFIGDPYNGVKVINMAAGDDKYLTYSGPTLSWSETPKVWTMALHPSGGDFMLYEKVESTTSTIYLGATDVECYNAKPLTYSNDGVVKGGRITIEEVPADYKDMVLANITPYFSTNLDKYYGLTTASSTSLKSTYDYWDGLTTCTESEYNSLYDAVMAAIVYPAENKYYRIKNYSTSRFIGKEGASAATFTSGTTASTVVYLSKSESTYNLTIQGANAYSGTTMVVGAPGLVTINTEGHSTYRYLRDSGGTIETWSAEGTSTTPQAYWYIEDATTFEGTITNAKDNTGTDHSYATLCVPFAISALSGANAYMPTVSDGYVVLGDAATVSDGTLIPAGTPAILVGDKDAGTYTATIKSGAPATSSATTNVLTGTFTGTSFNCTAGTTNYVLGFDSTNDNRIGFYHVSGGSSFALSANRAYLNTSVGAGVKGFAISFDELVDGIKAMDNTPVVHDGPIFNLAGQRMNKLQRGVNIVKGKKFIVK